MSTALYLLIMLGIILLVSLVAVPSLLWKKCRQCGRRNSLDALHCANCGKPLSDDTP